MSNSIHTFVQLLVVGGWLIILLFSFFRKREYLSLAHKILLPVVTLGFSGLNTTLFNAVNFKTDWYSILFYVSQLSAQLMFAFNFHQRETKIDKLQEIEMSLDVFKKIASNSLREIWVAEYATGIMLYTNDVYKKLYNVKEDGRHISELWQKEYAEEFLRNNKRALELGGEILHVTEPVDAKRRKKFIKFCATMKGKTVIIGMGNE